MNREETARLLVLIESLDHRHRFTAQQVTAWQVVLDDVPLDLATEAVIEHYRSTHYAALPGDIRRRAAANAGLLAPPEVVAWAHAKRVAQAEGEGRRSLHPAIREAYDVLGGSMGPLRDAGSTARAQFRDTYNQIKSHVDTEVLTGRIPRMTPAITAPEERKELTP